MAESALVRVLHISDIHCGHSFVDANVAAALEVAAASRFDAIVVSGDFTQRARAKEFIEARAILDRFRAIAPTIEVPGNHDTAWWHAPFGWGDRDRLHEAYRQYINPELEPIVQLPGVCMVGLNSAAGMLPQAVTWYPRDWRVKGGLAPSQFAAANDAFTTCDGSALRLLVLHHNVLRGNLSNRWGLKDPNTALNAIGALDVDVVCTGHDHEERAEVVQREGPPFLVSAANTLSRRVRGRRATSLNVIEADAATVTVTAWTLVNGGFAAGLLTASMPRRTRAP